MTSSRDFRPVWPEQQSGEFGTLSLPDIQMPGTTSSAPGSHGSMPLPELAGTPAESTAADRAKTDRDAVQLAFDRGFAEGLEQGIARTYEKIAPALEALSGLVKSLEHARADFDRDAEQNIYALALATTRHLIQREVTTDPTIVRDLVQQALDLVPHDVTVEVRLNPDDLTALGEHLDPLGTGGRPLHAQWIADSALERGSFLLETPLRVVDGRTEDVLRALYERLSHE